VTTPPRPITPEAILAMTPDELLAELAACRRIARPPHGERRAHQVYSRLGQVMDRIQLEGLEVLPTTTPDRAAFEAQHANPADD
jgi:hypothetical protein